MTKTVSLLVLSTPGNSLVTINGESRGETDAQGQLELSLTPGSYRIRVARDGFAAREADVEIGATPAEQQVEFSLPVALVTLNVVTFPPESEVYLNDMYKGTSNSEGLIVFDRINPNQPHKLRVRKDGYVQQSVPVTSYTGQISVRLLSDSIKLKVLTVPPGAEVYLDDSYKGTSMEDGVLVIEQVNPNQRHTLRGKKDGYLPQVVNVQPNETQATISLSSDPLVLLVRDLKQQLAQGKLSEAFEAYNQLSLNSPLHQELPRLQDAVLQGLQTRTTDLLKQVGYFGLVIDVKEAEELSRLYGQAVKWRNGDEALENFAKYWRTKYVLAKTSNPLAPERNLLRQEARSILSELVETNIRNSNLLLDLGWAWKTLDDQTKAQKYFVVAQEIKPEWAYPHFALGYLAMKEGDFERAKSARNTKFAQAIERFNKAIDLKHDFARAYASRSMVYQTLKAYDEAIASGLQATTLDPQSAYAHLALGTSYFLSGKKHYRNAREELNKTLTIGGSDIDSETRALVQQRLAQISKSIK